MCYEHAHHCHRCDREYHCSIPNKLCPTVNFDADANLCDDCREVIERELAQMGDDELKEIIRKGWK